MNLLTSCCFGDFVVERMLSRSYTHARQIIKPPSCFNIFRLSRLIIYKIDAHKTAMFSDFVVVVVVFRSLFDRIHRFI